MPAVSDTPERSQHRYWSNAEALQNMPFMVVTEDVIHEPMGWLNARAP